jgi:O-antigen ligase
MHAGLRAPDRRVLTFIAAGLLASLCAGLLAGRSPLIAVALVLGAAAAAAMLRDLAVGVLIFTFGSFAEAVQAGGTASASKGLGGLLLLSWIVALVRSSPEERRTLIRDQRVVVALAVGLVAWSLVSAMWAQSRSTALLGTSRYAQVLVLLPIVYAGVRRFTDLRRVAASFVIGGLFFTAFGAAAGATIDGSRLGGALGDPNDTAAALAAAAVLAFALGAGEHRSSPRRWAWFGAALLALLGLVATASRGGIVALAVTAVAAIVVGGRWRRQAILAATGGVILVICWFSFLAPASSRSHISSTQTPRTTIWTVAGRAIAANPIVGLGNNNFTTSSKNYLIAPGATARADQIVTTPEPAHNTYLEIWADLGIVGLALFLAIVVAALRSSLAAAAVLGNAGRLGDELLAKALVVAIVAMLSAYFFISYQYSKQLWLLLAFALAALPAARAHVSALGRSEGRGT